MAAMIPILVTTRPQKAGAAFAASVLDELGTDLPVISAPAFRIVPLPYDQGTPAGYIFTSAQAAAFAPPGNGMQAWCVGDATSHAAQSKGYTVRNARGDAAALTAMIAAARPTGPLVHLAGRHRHGDIANQLSAAGIPCTTVIAYDQVATDLPPALVAAARQITPLVAPVFSARSAQGLLKISGHASLHVIAISAAVASLFEQFNGVRVLTAGHPDADHVRRRTVAVLRDLLAAGD